MGPRAAETLSCRMGAVIDPRTAGYDSAAECRTMGPRAAETLSCRMGAVIDPRTAGYDSAAECRTMGPRAAETLSCRMGAAILPNNADIVLPNLAVIDPQYADTVLQWNAD